MKHNLDYAPYYLEVKRLVNESHELLKKGRYKEAEELLESAVVELRMMRIAVKSHIKT